MQYAVREAGHSGGLHSFWGFLIDQNHPDMIDMIGRRKRKRYFRRRAGGCKWKNKGPH